LNGEDTIDMKLEVLGMGEFGVEEVEYSCTVLGEFRFICGL
jgi:hypothetical protein